ncbi:MAG: CoA synthetase [Betaproteobacteria bacterium RIFCSPHIGHO2_12_FULL_69_13]|nr:MAG: CoA synthetase [Betaproteobacteria bacterium RIFCSPHIGHO2_12_FULL_69_13]OGA68215.1 MAG: CoA synthetase [Betaproteobacteria bacterium RIFCSPLOWO2_12_FULL_68_20]
MKVAQEELLACVVARLIGEARHVAVGAASPIPATACALLRAQGIPLRVSLLHRRRGNAFTEGSRELFDLAGQGRIDVFFLGGAQIDGEANINLVQAEGRRFPGSFGSAFMYFAAKRTILFREEHSRRVLVPKVEFVSAPGWSPPNVERRGGPAELLTGKALFSWQKEKRRFRLESVHPGHTADEVREHTGFDFDAEGVGVTPDPTAAELASLRGAAMKEVAADYPDFARRVWGFTPT